MNMDMQRFHATFFEESREGLEAMEAGLLSLEQGNRDGDLINSIFRAAHSIKVVRRRLASTPSPA